MATACTLALRPHIKWSAIVPAPLRLLDEFCHRRLFQQLALVAHAERRLVRNLGIGQAPPPHQFCRDRRSLPAELSPRRAAGRAPRLRLGVARGGRGHAAGGTLCRTREEASCPLYFTRRAARFPIVLCSHNNVDCFYISGASSAGQLCLALSRNEVDFAVAGGLAVQGLVLQVGVSDVGD